VVPVESLGGHVRGADEIIVFLLLQAFNACKRRKKMYMLLQAIHIYILYIYTFLRYPIHRRKQHQRMHYRPISNSKIPFNHHLNFVLANNLSEDI